VSATPGNSSSISSGSHQTPHSMSVATPSGTERSPPAPPLGADDSFVPMDTFDISMSSLMNGNFSSDPPQTFPAGFFDMESVVPSTGNAAHSTTTSGPSYQDIWQRYRRFSHQVTRLNKQIAEAYEGINNAVDILSSVQRQPTTSGANDGDTLQRVITALWDVQDLLNPQNQTNQP